jgi:hypothetical protein
VSVAAIAVAPLSGCSRHRAVRLASLAVAATLAACGGGGGASVEVDPATLPVLVEGAVVKGPVSGARVCAAWIVDGQTQPTTEACTTSGPDGSYRLEMPRRAGVLAVSAAGGSYADEAAPGTRVSVTALRTAVPFDGIGHSLTAQVTALTELMVRRAAARGALDASTVAAATQEVSRVFGVSGLTRTRPADVTLRDANVAGTTELLYGLANSGVRGWMAEVGLQPSALDAALTRLAERLAGDTLHEELAAFRAGIRRVIVANPESGLAVSASAYASMLALDFGAPLPNPTTPQSPIVEQDGTQRFAARWPLDDLFARPVGVVCVTNVPAAVPQAMVRAAVDAHAATYDTTVTAMVAVERCLGAGQSITLDWSRPSTDPWGVAVWGDGS